MKYEKLITKCVRCGIGEIVSTYKKTKQSIKTKLCKCTFCNKYSTQNHASETIYHKQK